MILSYPRQRFIEKPQVKIYSKPSVVKEKPIKIIKKGITPNGKPFKQEILQTGERYLQNGKQTGYSFSKKVSYVSGPQIVQNNVPKKQLTLKNIFSDVIAKERKKRLSLSHKPQHSHKSQHSHKPQQLVLKVNPRYKIVLKIIQLKK